MRRWSWEVESGWRLGIHSGTKRRSPRSCRSSRVGARSRNPGVRRRSARRILGLHLLRSNVEPFDSNCSSIFPVLVFLTITIRPFFGRINCRLSPSLIGNIFREVLCIRFRKYLRAEAQNNLQLRDAFGQCRIVPVTKSCREQQQGGRGGASRTEASGKEKRVQVAAPSASQARQRSKW
jgi:hypothetical protein